MTCKACSEDIRNNVPGATDRKCAFPDGVFNPDNLNCPTILKLHEKFTNHIHQISTSTGYMLCIRIHDGHQVIMNRSTSVTVNGATLLYPDGNSSPLTEKLALTLLEQGAWYYDDVVGAVIPPRIDYRNLLSKYIRHIADIEGWPLLPTDIDSCESFTKQEEKALDELAKDL